MFEDKFFIVFLRKEDKINRIIGSVRVDCSSPIVKRFKKCYTIDFKNPTYVSKNKRFYLIDKENGQQYFMEKTNPVLSPEELDLLIGNHVISEITSGVLDDNKQKLLMIGIGLCIGGLIGYIISNTIMQDKIDKLQTSYAPITLKSLFSMLKLFIMKC